MQRILERSLRRSALCAALVLSGACQARPDRIEFVDTSTSVERLQGFEDAYDLAEDGDGRTQARDRYARLAIATIDAYHDGFVGALVSSRKRFDVSTDVGAIALDAASVLFTPASTKSILAALSGLTTATRTSVDKAYYYEQALPALISQMEANRGAVLVDIHTGLASDAADYPLYRLTTDLRRYIHAGTIEGALQEIQRSAARKGERAELQLRALAVESIEEARLLRARGERAAGDAVGFDALRANLKVWWQGLDDDEQLEQMDLVQGAMRALGIAAPTTADGRAEGGASFEEVLDSLSPTDPAHRALLARITSNTNPAVIPSGY